jgi:septum formation protein
MSSVPTLILASQSPRRVELLRQLGFEFEVRPVDLDETWDGTEPPQRYVERLAREKACAGRALAPGAAVLGADTVVVIDGSVLGKPRNRPHAAGMLARLSGRTHQVYSAIALADGGLESRVNVTAVTFRPLTAEEIDDYLATGEADDKAGAYAIQGLAAAFIERIDGSYSGVMGLPLFESARLLARIPSISRRTAI